MAEADGAERRLRVAAQRGRIVEGRRAGAFQANALDVDVGRDDLRLAGEPLRLGERLAQFVDRSLPVPGEVGGALAVAGRRIGVGGDAAHRLGGAEQRAVGGLADGDVGCGEVAEDRRAGERAHRGGRRRRPVVLADLDVEHEVPQVLGREQQVRPERRRLAGDIELEPPKTGAGGEPALLVILAVVRQEGLGDHAKDAATGDGDGAIVDPTGPPQRRAQQQDRAEVAAALDDLAERALDAGEQRVLQVEVVDRIARQPELRVDQQVDALLSRRDRLLDGRRGVPLRIGDEHLRRRDADAHEAMPVERREACGFSHGFQNSSDADQGLGPQL